MSVPTLPRIPKTQKFIQQFKIRAEHGIPEWCDEYAMYEDLRRILQHSNSTTPCFEFSFMALERSNGFSTRGWILGPECFTEIFGGRFEARFYKVLKPTCFLNSYLHSRAFLANHHTCCLSTRTLHKPLKSPSIQVRGGEMNFPIWNMSLFLSSGD